MSSNLFSDLLVIDCASFIAGPAAATVMSDFGARVIKIEPPGIGDSYRNLFRLRGTPDDIDYFWAMDSRNKESLALDLKLPAARAVLETLVRRADVFITNFPFPVRERLRLRSEDLLHLNERLIYASLSPYGEHGPDRDRTGFDTTAWWARSGLMEMVRATGETERALSMPGMGDHPTAMALYGAIVTALYRRQLTGKGGEVTTSLVANGLWSNACQVQGALCGYELAARGARGTRGALAEEYATADGRAFIITSTNPARDWPLLARAVGHPEWLEDPRFATPMERFANTAALVALLDDVFASDSWETWRDRLIAGGVTFGIVGRIEDHISDPQLEANGILPEFEDGYGLRTVDSPFQIAGIAKEAPRMAPGIGQHTRPILQELGLAPAEIEALSASE
ncbi:MAG TPA: CoA transferase [Caulobacteraceae bacterium]|nr:CoA transferase [Caulobacteraceae bacterium]